MSMTIDYSKLLNTEEVNLIITVIEEKIANIDERIQKSNVYFRVALEFKAKIDSAGSDMDPEKSKISKLVTKHGIEDYETMTVATASQRVTEFLDFYQILKGQRTMLNKVINKLNLILDYHINNNNEK